VADLVARIRALEHRVHDAQAAERQDFDGGVAYFNRDLPHVWDLNFVRLDRPDAAIAKSVDRLMSGLGHRKVLVEEDELLERFGVILRERGYGERTMVALAREPGGVLDANVRELGFEQVRDLKRAIKIEQSDNPLPEVIDQMTEAGRWAEAAGGRCLVMFEGDNPVAHCTAYSYGGLAQIEDVATLEAHQRKGHSRRLLLHAMEWVAADHDAVFIPAETDDWPVEFYKRLGFRHVEDRSDFLLIVADP
jgi:GNAT superfamily N-acetyltransferase